MTITREQVADLQPGDVVELTHVRHPDVSIRGPLTADGGMLRCGFAVVLHSTGDLPLELIRTLTVVSRAPRPLYVNHPRAEAVAGDVVAPPDDDGPLPGWRPTWARTNEGAWVGTHTGRPIAGEMLDRLRLLVDGETGQVVPS